MEMALKEIMQNEKMHGNWKEFTTGKKYHYMVPCLEMKTQVIIFLTTAILQWYQKCCVGYFSSRGHQMLTLIFLKGPIQISLLHGNIQGSS